MGLSLAQNSRKTRIGADPRNTQWAHDTDRFGHQQLMKMGWKPGRGLGASVEGAKEHVKVKVKTDAKGLGSTIGQQDQPTGLDVFQRILGKLNGNQEEVDEMIKKKERLSGLYLQFVPGGVLEGTVKSKKEMKAARKSAEKQRKKAAKQAEKEASRLKSLAAEESKKASTKSEPERSQESPQPAESKPAKSKPAESKPAESKPAVQARGIRATRNRYIAMKRKATQDSQSLKEILMQ